MTSRCVLFIDDESNILKAIERLFRKEDLEVYTTTSPQEACDHVTSQEFAVVVSDQRMPEMPGTHLLEKIRELSPATIRMTLTGYADKEAAIEAINRGAVSRFLTKPWDDEDFKRDILSAIEAYNLRDDVKRLQEVTQEQNRQLQEWNTALEQKVEERTAEISNLNRDLRSSLMTSIAVMAQLGEMHSSLIGNHSKRVATLSKNMAQAMKLDTETISNIYAAALLHDIGKMGLPAAILQKDPGLYMESERETYRTHVIEGERIISMVPAIRTAARLVRSHHERWNGAGYPDRLTGDEIPLGARIIAVADAYDNTLHQRSGALKFTPSQALKQVVRASGEWFDPEIVKCLILTLGDENKVPVVTQEIELSDLKPGMHLAADIRTVQGKLLASSKTMVTQSLIDLLTTYTSGDPLEGSLLIVREPPGSSCGPELLNRQSAV